MKFEVPTAVKFKINILPSSSGLTVYFSDMSVLNLQLRKSLQARDQHWYLHNCQNSISCNWNNFKSKTSIFLFVKCNALYVTKTILYKQQIHLKNIS